MIIRPNSAVLRLTSVYLGDQVGFMREGGVRPADLVPLSAECGKSE
ncbi:MAG TPA: hypothetical protein VEV61_00010 [Streptosporangiaceae bacterium]|nr:hypothetical protein [Streptosporangiaceae bacterium]